MGCGSDPLGPIDCGRDPLRPIEWHRFGGAASRCHEVLSGALGSSVVRQVDSASSGLWQLEGRSARAADRLGPKGRSWAAGVTLSDRSIAGVTLWDRSNGIRSAGRARGAVKCRPGRRGAAECVRSILRAAVCGNSTRVHEPAHTEKAHTNRSSRGPDLKECYSGRFIRRRVRLRRRGALLPSWCSEP